MIIVKGSDHIIVSPSMCCFHVYHALLSVHCSLVVTCLGRVNVLAILCDILLCFVTFPCGVLIQVWYLIDSIADLCFHTYFDPYL